MTKDSCFPQAYLDKLEVGRNMQPGGDFPLVLRQAGLLFILVACVQGAIWRKRARSRIVLDPELDSGFRTFVRVWLIYGNLPWLLLGGAVLCGALPPPLNSLDPRHSPYAGLILITIVLLWVATFEGLFFRGHAEVLLTYPGVFDVPLNRPWAVKLWFLICLSGGITGVILLIFLKLHLV
jgi:hypothetical protein